jgi:predicted nucleotidyltransferase
MVDLLENQKQAIAELWRKYNVEKLFAFGLAIRNDCRPVENDVDLLLDQLQQLLGVKVNLVMSGAVLNAAIAHEIETAKRMI